MSGPGLAQTHRDLHGIDLDAGQLHAGTFDSNLEETVECYLRLLAGALAGVINIVDPDVIVLGGGLSNIARLYSGLEAALAEQVFSDCLRTRVTAPRHGDSSGVRGAAWLWP